MTNITNTVQELPNLLALNPASSMEITDAELQLRLNFSDEYKTYLSTFGAIIADGIELTGISKAKHRNVVPVTKQEWELNTNVPHTLYVIENTGVDGIIIWQDSTGLIYQTTGATLPKEVAHSINDYLIDRLK